MPTVQPKPRNVHLRGRRRARNRTQEEIVRDLIGFADRLHAAGEIRKRLSLSVKQYAKWETSPPPWPHPETRVVLEKFFQCRVTDLGFTPPQDEEPSTAGPSVPPGAGSERGKPARLFAGAASLTEESPPWLAPTIPDQGGASDWRIGEAEVELLRTAADDMDAIDQQFGGNRLWRPTRAHLLWVHHMIDRGIYDDELGRQLHTVSGRLTTSLGWFCYDAGRQDDARKYFSEALNTALFTGDDILASRTLSNMARQAVDLNKGREAVRFARLAQTHAKEWAAPHRVAALLSIREAQGHARIGDDLACEKAIRRAWRAWERGVDDRDPEWTLFLNEAELTCLEGMCRLDLGQNGRAQKLLAHSEALQDIAHSRNRGMCLGRLSAAALGNRDVDHSVAAATESLRLIERGMSSARAMNQLTIVHNGLARHRRKPEVRDLLDQIRERVA
ncbi:hypothetical protein ACMATS_25245 [Streptoverticillium reticulum]|uniref:hypothetical protein n=1 Tax=Streptoverticillium reticulum TaxID=1433415 RepID=UPI0039BEFB08